MGEGEACGKRPLSAGRYQITRVGAWDRMFPQGTLSRRYRIAKAV